MAPLLAFVVADIPRVVLQWRPDFRRGGHDVLETPRHHPDDGVQVAVERDLATYNRTVAVEAPPPQYVTEDRHMGTLEAVVGWQEIPAQDRRDAQRAEITGAHTLPIEAFGLGRAGYADRRRLPRLHYRHRLERTAARCQLAISVKCHVAAYALEAIPDHHDPASLRIWQRLEQDRVDRAEDGRASADT